MDASLDFTAVAPYLTNPLVLAGFALFLLFGFYKFLVGSGLLPPVTQETSGQVVAAFVRNGLWIAALVILLGFALAFFQQARGDPILQMGALGGALLVLGFGGWAVARSAAPHESAPDLLAGIRGLNRLEPEELAAVKAAIDALVSQKGPAIERAKAELARGNTEAAEAIFARTLEHKAAEGAAANREAAEAARHLGALAWLHDGEKALAAYRRAAELDPDDAWTWIFIGRLEVRLGRLGHALAAFQNALAVATQLAAAEPSRAARQRDVYVSESSIADVLVQQGRLGAAAEAYQKVLETCQRLAQAEPSNTEWQRDLSVSLNKIGDVRRAQGDLKGALSAYEQGLAIAGRLAQAEPSNTEWQRDLSVSLNKIGDVRRAQGDLKGALSAYEQGLAIAGRLAQAEPSNTEWQRDLIVSNVKLAALASGSGKQDEAAGRYRRALGIARALADTGRLAPVDAWMVADLEQRLAGAVSPEPAAAAR